MKSSFITHAIVILTIIVTCTPNALGVYPGKTGDTHNRFAPTRLIVKFTPEARAQMSITKTGAAITTGISSIDQLHSAFAVSQQNLLFAGFEQTALKDERFAGVYILTVADGTNIESMRTAYTGLSEVEYAEPDYTVELFDTPNDFLFKHQWSLNNLGINQNDGLGYLGNDRETVTCK